MNNYLTQLNEAKDIHRDGFKLANLLSAFETIKNLNTEILNEYDKFFVQKWVFAPWDEVVVNHFECCISLVKQQDHVKAYEYKAQMFQTLCKVIQGIKDENWMLPVLFVTSIELRKLALAADKSIEKKQKQENKKPNEHLENAASILIEAFRLCVNDNRAAIEVSKRKGILNIINQLFKIYFKINKLHLCKPLIRAIETNSNLMEHFTMSQRVTYAYFIGMKLLFDSEYKQAEQQLSWAFQNCHPQSFNNQRLILIFLIPVKMLLGHMPTVELLHRFNLMEFQSVLQAVKSGNIKLLEQTLQENADFFWKHGIYLILERLKIIAYRNIFKKVALITGSHQIDIESFRCALKYLENESISMEEVHCILANLIYEGKIKGYISLIHQKLVISKQNPFPLLSSITAVS